MLSIVASTTIFLDVDGVLSPWREGSQAWDDWEAMPYGSYSILLSPAMAARVAALPARVVWLTTWQHLANSEIGAYLGWTELDVVGLSAAPTSGEAKADALRGALEFSTGPVVLIDDDPEVHARAKVLLMGRPSLAIQPDPAVGLTRDHLDEVERFISSQGQEAIP